jgi:hypothetical protein
VIDLHRDIVGSGRGHVDFNAVWGRLAPGWPAGAYRLDAVDELVFHLVHMSRNRLCGPLIQVVDAARLIARQTTPLHTVIDRARSWGLGASASAALAYCHDVLAARRRPGGWLGPSNREAIAAQAELPRKLVFDLATAGSLSQLAARALAFATSRFN